MTTFIEQLAAADHWTPPEYPALDDPAWLETLAKASLAKKENIANGWMWQLNSAYALLDRHTSPARNPFSWMLPNLHIYAEMSKYCNRDMIKDAEFNGTLQSWNDRRLQRVEPSAELAAKLMWSDASNVRQCIVDLLTYREGDGDSLYYSDDPFALFHTLVWGKMEQHRLLDDKECLRLASNYSVIAGIRRVYRDVEPCNAGPSNPVNRAWYTLGYHCTDKVKPVGAKAMHDAALEVIKTLPIECSVEPMYHALQRAIRTIRGGYVVQPKTFLNLPNVGMKSVYPLLQTWLPALAHQWTIAELCDAPWEQAMTVQIETLKRDAQAMQDAKLANLDMTI